MSNAKLTMYHANAHGTGSALTLELVPAANEVEGAIIWRLAPQKSESSTFDWMRSIEARLHLVELADVLRVFRGEQESIADGKGLFIRRDNNYTVVRLRHTLEPCQGYEIAMIDRNLASGVVRDCRIWISRSEAVALCCAVEQSLARVAFG